MHRIGDRVLAQWPAEMEWWYPGTVIGAEGGAYLIQYDDGDRARLSEAQLRNLYLGVSSRVFGNFQHGGRYYPGKITQVQGQAIHIAYDDGDHEWTTIGQVRVHHGDLR